MLTIEIKKLEFYQTFLVMSIGLIPPKKTKDVSLELGKSMSLTKAEEEEVSRRVHATHERLVTKSDEPANRPTAIKAIRKVNRSQLHTGCSNKGVGAKLEVLDESSDYSKEEKVDEKEIEWVSTNEEEEQQNDKGDDDDRNIDIKETDVDEKTNDEYIHKDEYVHNDVDEEMTDAGVAETRKDDNEESDTAKENVEKTEEVKGDNKKSGNPLTSSSLYVSLGFGNHFLNLSFDKSSIRTIKDSADVEINTLLDI
ncbi:hypothetical protein Tco_1024135 [Tanacetum coccineum]